MASLAASFETVILRKIDDAFRAVRERNEDLEVLTVSRLDVITSLHSVSAQESARNEWAMVSTEVYAAHEVLFRIPSNRIIF